MATRHTDQAYRIEENERNAASMATRCTDPSYRILEQNADTNPRRLTRQTPLLDLTGKRTCQDRQQTDGLESPGSRTERREQRTK
jgi:hypothetical protein